MESTHPAYGKLMETCQELAFVNSSSSALHWDQETYMPPKALAYRAKQLAFLGGWAHRKFTSPETGRLIAECEDCGFPAESPEAVNVRQLRRAYDKQTKIPSALVEELSQTSSLSRQAWVDARTRRDFPHFQPFLEKLIALNRQVADHLGGSSCRYDTLMDQYEEGESSARLREVFSVFKKELSTFLPEAVELSRAIPRELLDGHYPRRKSGSTATWRQRLALTLRRGESTPRPTLSARSWVPATAA